MIGCSFKTFWSEKLSSLGLVFIDKINMTMLWTGISMEYGPFEYGMRWHISIVLRFHKLPNILLTLWVKVKLNVPLKVTGS